MLDRDHPALELARPAAALDQVLRPQAEGDLLAKRRAVLPRASYRRDERRVTTDVVWALSPADRAVREPPMPTMHAHVPRSPGTCHGADTLSD